MQIQFMYNTESQLYKGKDAKTRKCDTRPDKWSSLSMEWKKKNIKKFIEGVNRHHVSMSQFTYRNASSITLGVSMLLVDVDAEGELEPLEKLIDGYEYIKTPSASYDAKEKPYKWHYFILLNKPCDENVYVAKDQEERLYKKLGFMTLGIDFTAISPSRYFSPAGAKFKKYSDEWKEWVIESDKLSVHHKGKILKNVKPDKSKKAEVQETTLSSFENLTMHDIKSIGGIKGLRKMQKKKVKKVKHYSYYHEKDTHTLWAKADYPVYVGNGMYATVQSLYDSVRGMEKGVKLGGRIPCPFCAEHSQNNTDALGYGLIYLNTSDMIQIKCAGNGCKDKNPICFKNNVAEDSTPLLTRWKNGVM